MPSRVDTLPEPAPSEPDRPASTPVDPRAAARVLEVLGLEAEPAGRLVRVVSDESGLSAARLADAAMTVTETQDQPQEPSDVRPSRVIRYRAVDREGAVVCLPTTDAREVALACAGSSHALPQSSASAPDEGLDDAAWVDGLAGYDDVRPLLELSPEVLRGVDLVVLANPLAAAGGHATVRVLLLDARGGEVARGSLLRDLFGSRDVHESDGVVRALGLRRDGGWLVADTGETEIFRAARVRPFDTAG